MRRGFFPLHAGDQTCSTDLREAIAMLLEEGLDAVCFARHQRPGGGYPRCRRAIGALKCSVLSPPKYSPVLTAVLMPPGHDARQVSAKTRAPIPTNMSLGSGLSKLAGKVCFALVHLGECNETGR